MASSAFRCEVAGLEEPAADQLDSFWWVAMPFSDFFWKRKNVGPIGELRRVDCDRVRVAPVNDRRSL
jgi:hypothetical protein